MKSFPCKKSSFVGYFAKPFFTKLYIFIPGSLYVDGLLIYLIGGSLLGKFFAGISEKFGFKNCSQYPFEGGHAKVLLGNVFGIWVVDIKGWSNISSKVGLLDGSKFKIFEIKFFAFSDIEAF